MNGREGYLDKFPHPYKKLPGRFPTALNYTRIFEAVDWRTEEWVTKVKIVNNGHRVGKYCPGANQMNPYFVEIFGRAFTQFQNANLIDCDCPVFFPDP